MVSEYANEDIFISVITLGEIAKGIALLDDGARKTQLFSWLNGLESNYADNILKTDTETARIWGALTAKAQRKGKQVSAGGGLIAATTIFNGLQLVHVILLILKTRVLC